MNAGSYFLFRFFFSVCLFEAQSEKFREKNESTSEFLIWFSCMRMCAPLNFQWPDTVTKRLNVTFAGVLTIRKSPIRRSSQFTVTSIKHRLNVCNCVAWSLTVDSKSFSGPSGRWFSDRFTKPTCRTDGEECFHSFRRNGQIYAQWPKSSDEWPKIASDEGER